MSWKLSQIHCFYLLKSSKIKNRILLREGTNICELLLYNIKETAKYKPLLDILFNGNMGLLDLFSRVNDNLDESAFHIVKLLETFPKRKALEVVSGLCTTEMSLADNYHQIFQQPR